MKYKTKKIYYTPTILCINSLRSNSYIPISNLFTDFNIKNSSLNGCPVWNHKTSRCFVVYSSFDLEIKFNENGMLASSSTITNEDLENNISLVDSEYNPQKFILEINDLFSNFYWAEEKNIWISAQPHPLTALNNNFYHCGGWFNLTNWNRVINIGAIVVDKNKPLVIKRGDPLYTLQFHTENQNDRFELIQEENNLTKIENSQGIINFFRNNFFDNTKEKYDDIIFDSTPKQKSNCPFSFLFKK